MPADCAEFVTNLLKGDATITDYIVRGVDGIFEAGTLDPGLLAVFQTERRESGQDEQLLAIVVQDAGEEAVNEMTRTQRVAIWLYDRDRGPVNLRAMRPRIAQALHDKTTSLDDPFAGHTIMTGLRFWRRSGHIIDHRLEVGYERLIFESTVTVT